MSVKQHFGYILTTQHSKISSVCADKHKPALGNCANQKKKTNKQTKTEGPSGNTLLLTNATIVSSASSFSLDCCVFSATPEEIMGYIQSLCRRTCLLLLHTLSTAHRQWDSPKLNVYVWKVHSILHFLPWSLELWAVNKPKNLSLMHAMTELTVQTRCAKSQTYATSLLQKLKVELRIYDRSLQRQTMITKDRVLQLHFLYNSLKYFGCPSH